jgi:ATP-binding cassette subfamily B protein
MIRELLTALGPAGSRPVKRLLVLSALTAVLQGGAFLALVPVLDDLVHGDEPVASLVVFTALCLAWIAGTLVVQQHSFTVGAGLARVLQHRIDAALAQLPRGWFRRGRAGEVSQLVGSTALAAMNIPAHFLRPLTGAVVTPVVLVIGLTIIAPPAGIAMIVASPVLFLLLWATDRSVSRADGRRHRSMDHTAERLLEFARIQPVLRAFGSPDRASGNLDRVLVEQQHADRRLVFSSVPGVVAYDLVSRTLYLVAIVVAAVQLSSGAIGVAQLVGVVVIGIRLSEAIGSAAGLTAGMRMVRRGLAAVNAFLETPPQVWPDRPEAAKDNTVRFSGVGFAYDDEPVLHGVDLDLPERGLTAIVGPSGAGKSTLVSLIPRFFDPDAGSVQIGDVDVRRLSQEDIATRVAMVMQQVHLVDGTLRDNVALGRPDASDDEVRHALRLAHLDHLVARLEQGVDTPVGDRGDRFSGGEKQRIALARALVADSPIIVLDEVTSALDPESDRAVSAAIHAISHEKNVIVITHRLAGVRDADRIVVMENGRVVQRGRHDDLLRDDGVYRRLWEAQTASEGWRLRN